MCQCCQVLYQDTVAADAIHRIQLDQQPADGNHSACLQVVQNALVWSKLERESFTRRIAKRGYQGIDHMEVKALWALVAIEAALLIMFLALAISMMWVPCISACRQHKVGDLHQQVPVLIIACRIGVGYRLCT